MEKLFHLKENGTNVKTEIRAGITTFMAMAYILMVNAGMFSDLIASFIRTGDPNNPTLPVYWPAFHNETSDTLVINASPYVAQGVRPEDVKTLLPLLKEYPQLAAKLGK